MQAAKNHLAKNHFEIPVLGGGAKEAHTCATHGAFTSTYLRGPKIWTGCPTCSRMKAEQEDRKEREKAKAEASQRRWHERIGFSGIPERFQDRTLESFVADTERQHSALAFAKAYADDFARIRRTGRSAIFSGKPGTGKTHLACGIALHAMKEHGARVLFMTVQRALRSIKNTYAKGSEVSESEAIDRLVAPDLLILDEVGVQFGSDFERNTLFDVLNERYEKRKPTIFLSNLTKDELAAFLGERVMDRLREDGGTVISFTWDSHRGKVCRAELGGAV